MSGEDRSRNNLLVTAFTPFRTLGDKAPKIHVNVQTPGSDPLGADQAGTGGLRESSYLSGTALSAH